MLFSNPENRQYRKPAPQKLEAHYELANVHFYFDAVTDKSKRYPWQKLATHPKPAARIKALKIATGRG